MEAALGVCGGRLALCEIVCSTGPRRASVLGILQKWGM